MGGTGAKVVHLLELRRYLDPSRVESNMLNMEGNFYLLVLSGEANSPKTV